MVIVDGYNVIYAWACLREAEREGLEYAREKLIQIMTRYQDFNDKDVSIVFDGSKRFDNMCSDQINTDVNIIFSKNGKTADSTIERMIYKLPDKSRALVVTSDRFIRMMAGGMGARSVSSENFELMVKNQ
ncbi:NYN domain-containing protein [bacterium]|nr:NYN domain-containing protein [bacterium]